MAKVGLISCVSMKQNKEADASELYISPLFKKSKEYATERLDKFFILSAKYGLLKLYWFSVTWTWLSYKLKKSRSNYVKEKQVMVVRR